MNTDWRGGGAPDLVEIAVAIALLIAMALVVWATMADAIR